MTAAKSVRTLVALVSVAAPLSLAACGSRDRAETQPAGAERGAIGLNRYAAEHRLSGLSPASLSEVKVCHGLSLASATNCSTGELLSALIGTAATVTAGAASAGRADPAPPAASTHR